MGTMLQLIEVEQAITHTIQTPFKPSFQTQFSKF